MANISGSAYTSIGIMSDNQRSPRHILNTALQTRGGASAGMDVVLADGTLLRTFTSAQLVEYACCGVGISRDWESAGPGANVSTITWDNAEYDALTMADRIRVVNDLKSRLSDAQKMLIYSCSLSSGSLVAILVWKDGVTDVDALAITDELRDGAQFDGVRVRGRTLGAPTMSSGTTRAAVRECIPQALRTAPAASVSSRVS
jgi:hypothetical protein